MRFDSSPSRTRSGPRLRGGLGLVLLLGAAAGLATLAPGRVAKVLGRARVLASGGRFVEIGGMALQDSPWMCGPVALHNLFRALGVRSPGPEALAGMTGTGPEGSSLGRLVRTARELGVPLRARRVAGRELRSVAPPFLAWVDRGHFVTVLSVQEAGGVRVHDPMVGAYRLPFRTFLRRWDGVVADLESGGRPSSVPGDRSGSRFFPTFQRRLP